MPRRAARLATLLVLGPGLTAACPPAQAAGPFPEQVIRPARQRSHTWAYVALGAGAGLVGASFVLADRANDAYDEYLAATDADHIVELFEETERYDRLASASLISGELLLAAGLYLRFLRRPPPLRVSLGPERCAVAWRF